MSFQHTITRSVSCGSGDVKSQQKSQTGSSEKNLSESIGTGTNGTDLPVAWTCDVSALKSLHIQADYDLTLKTNGTGTNTVDTLSLKANQPVQWQDGDPTASKPFSVDVTALYVTNAGSNTASLDIRSLEDATP